MESERLVIGAESYWVWVPSQGKSSHLSTSRVPRRT